MTIYALSFASSIARVYNINFAPNTKQSIFVLNNEWKEQNFWLLMFYNCDFLRRNIKRAQLWLTVPRAQLFRRAHYYSRSFNRNLPMSYILEYKTDEFVFHSPIKQVVICMQWTLKLVCLMLLILLPWWKLQH